MEQGGNVSSSTKEPSVSLRSSGHRDRLQCGYIGLEPCHETGGSLGVVSEGVFLSAAFVLSFHLLLSKPLPSLPSIRHGVQADSIFVYHSAILYCDFFIVYSLSSSPIDYLRTLGSTTSNAPTSRLIRILDDHEAVIEVLAVPSSIITEQQLHALMQIARHFGILNEDDNESGDDPDEENDDLDKETSDLDGGETSRARKSARKPRPKVKAWAPFLRIKSLKLPPSVQ